MKLSNFTRIFIVLITLLFSVFSLLFILNFSNYISEHFAQTGIDIPSAAVVIAGAVLCSPCFFVLVMAFPLARAIENDTVFTQKTAKTLSLMSKIMFFDCLAFLLAVILLFVTKECLFASILGILDLAGFSAAFHLRLLSSYISRAAKLKEEADFTL